MRSGKAWAATATLIFILVIIASTLGCHTGDKGGTLSDEGNISQPAGGKWCYIDKSGKVVLTLDPRFSSARSFSEGLAAVVQDALFGYIDRQGEVVIEPRFLLADQFHEGLAGVQLDITLDRPGGKYGYIDKSGELVLEDFQGFPFSEGLAAVFRDGKWGFIDKSGKFVIEPQYSFAGSFYGGLAPVEKNGRYYLVDKKGEVFLEQSYGLAMPFHDDLSLVEVHDGQTSGGGKFGYMDRNRVMVIEPKYDYASDFSEGLALAALQGEWGYIDTSGTMVIEPRYAYDASLDVERVSFSEGLAAVPSGTKWGYIDKEGKWAIEPKFDEAWPFSEGLALVYIAD
jgi:hypothetical protein